MKTNEIVYYCLDAIKAFSDDAYVNEDHILFLLGKYRGALLQQYHNIKKVIPDSNYQTICLNLQRTSRIPCVAGPRLKSIEIIPKLIPIGKPQVLLGNGMEDEIIEYVPFERLKSVGYNKWKKNFIYAAIGPDNLLYLAFCNPQAQYLKQLKFRGIFEDYEKALELECKDNKVCDIMEKDFPLEVMLVPDLIARVVKDALGVQYRPADRENNAADDLSTIATWIRHNMKSNIQKQIEGD